MRPWQQIQNQPQKPLRDLQEAKAKALCSANGAFAQLEDWIDDLQEADTAVLRQQLEAFKKMVFKMLNGKKKTVEVGKKKKGEDDMEEASGGPIEVPSAKNKAGIAPKGKNAKALLKGVGNEKSVGSATSTAKLILSKRFGS